MLLVASPAFAQPVEDGGLLPAVLLSRRGEVRDWLIEADGNQRRYRPDPVLRLSSVLMVHHAVRAASGAAVLPRSLAAQDLAAGTLVRWGDLAGRPVEVWALHASQRLASPKVTSFVAFLVEQFPQGSLEREMARALSACSGPELTHGDENAAMDRLQPVAGVGQGALGA